MRALPLPALDAGLEALFHLAPRLPSLSLGPRLAARPRREQARAIAARVRPFLEALAPAVVAGDPEATSRHDSLVEYAIRDLREARFPGLGGLASALDRAFYRNSEEFLDDLSFPDDERIHTLDFIDRFNTHLGSYDLWAGMLADDLAPGPGGDPVRVLDLASGHAGFALALKARLGAAVSITASDLVDEYLDLGRQHARERGLDLAFLPLDATALGAQGQGHDVLVCTQSLHHFSPGLLVRIVAEAARSARRAAWFIDAERGIAPAIVAGALSAAYGRSWAVVHDTVVSLRRMPIEEELFLLSELAVGIPEGSLISTGRRAPGFVFLRVGR
jgi:SAM-dependent methyltransferase